MGTKTISDTWTDISADKQAEVCEDVLLVEQAKSGSFPAFDKLTVKYRQKIFSIIYNLTSNREDASDLAQDAFIKAFRSIHKFKGNSSFFTWVSRIAINTTYTHLRKNKLRRFFSFETIQDDACDPELKDMLIANTNGGEFKGFFLNELQEKLNEALQTLSIKHRTVVVLHEIEGLSHQEIGKIVDCSEGTVRSRLHYAKNQLQSILKDYVSN